MRTDSRHRSMLPVKHDNVSVHNQYTCQPVNLRDQADRYRSSLAHPLNGSFHPSASLIDDGKEALIWSCSTLSTVEGPMRFNERHGPGSDVSEPARLAPGSGECGPAAFASAFASKSLSSSRIALARATNASLASTFHKPFAFRLAKESIRSLFRDCLMSEPYQCDVSESIGDFASFDLTRVFFGHGL